MKTTIFDAPGQPIRIETVPDPEPGPGEAVIRVECCGICGSDLHMTENPDFSYPRGLRLGHEYAGEVVALGRGENSLAVGDRVSALPAGGCGRCAECLSGEPHWCAEARWLMGGFSHYAVVEQRYAVKLPRNLSFADGALVEPLAASRHTCHAGGAIAGARALVLGAGPFALATAWWLRLGGAARVLITARSDRNRVRAIEMGADDLLIQDADVVARAVDRLGGPADIVYDCIGAPGMIETAVAAVRPKGTVVVAGMCACQDSWIPGSAVIKQLTMRFPNAYAFADFHAAVAALDGGHVEPRCMVTETIGLDALPARLEALRSDRTQCKVMVEPWA